MDRAKEDVRLGAPAAEERPRGLGDAAPDGPILGAKVEHLIAKEALLADESGVVFTTPHFDGYPAVLIRLPDASSTCSRRS